MPPTLSPPHRIDWMQTIGMVGVLVIVMSIPATAAYTTWNAKRVEKAAWTIDGPPCSVRTEPLPTGVRPMKVFDYGGARFARRFGHVSCVGLSDNAAFQGGIYHVCQFSAPGRLSVTVAGRTVVFEPGVGRRATVTVRGGAASCVLGGWFSH